MEAALTPFINLELLFVLRYIVETRGRTLEECAAYFDDEQQPQDLAAMGGEAATMTMSRVVHERTLSSIHNRDSVLIQHRSYKEVEAMEMKRVSTISSEPDGYAR